MVTLFQIATRTLVNNPHVGQMAQDNPQVVTLEFPNGTRYRAKPLAQAVTQFDQFGNVITQDVTKVISVSTEEVPEQPPRNTKVHGYQSLWYVQSAALSDTETLWRLDLFVEQ